MINPAKGDLKILMCDWNDCVQPLSSKTSSQNESRCRDLCVFVDKVLNTSKNVFCLEGNQWFMDFLRATYTSTYCYMDISNIVAKEYPFKPADLVKMDLISHKDSINHDHMLLGLRKTLKEGTFDTAWTGELRDIGHETQRRKYDTSKHCGYYHYSKNIKVKGSRSPQTFYGIYYKKK